MDRSFFIAALALGGLLKPGLRSEISIIFRNSLESIAYASEENSKKGQIRWEGFPDSVQKSLAGEDPAHILRIYDRIPEMSEPEIQGWIELAARKPFIYLNFQFHDVSKVAVQEFQSGLHSRIVQRRKDLGITKNPDEVKFVTSLERGIPNGIVQSGGRSLIYGSDLNHLRLLESLLASKRKNALIVHDDLWFSADALKEKDAMLAFLDQFFSSHLFQQKILAASDFVAQRILYDQQAKEEMHSSA